MNTKEYIESGILEAYVLGALPQTERALVEANIALYPELAQEVAAIEAAMQQFVEATPVEPPAHLKEQIWSAITGQAPAQRQSPKTIPFTGAERNRQLQWQRAAVWIALAGSLLANIMLWYQRNTSVQETALLREEMNQVTTGQETLAARLEVYEKERAMLSDGSMQPVLMQSMQQDKPMAGMVFWSKDKGEAYFSTLNMPMPPQGMQYQLWIIQDGKPVDMGMFPNEMITKGGMQKVAVQSQGLQAFAISLEKEGGNPTPTSVMVMGKIAS